MAWGDATLSSAGFKEPPSIPGVIPVFLPCLAFHPLRLHIFATKPDYNP